MVRILVCKGCEFGEKNLQQFRRYRICPMDYFLARPVYAIIHHIWLPNVVDVDVRNVVDRQAGR